MDRIQDSRKIGVACDLLLAWRTIADGTAQQTSRTRERYWRDWTAYNSQSPDPYLSNLTKCEKAVLLTAFGARVRTGAFGREDQVKVSSVTDALAAISKTCQLVGQQSPVYESEGAYILPIKRLVEGFRRSDPPAIPQMAVPVAVAEMAATLGYLTHNPRAQAVGDLALIAFYYLLRSGEYTRPIPNQRHWLLEGWTNPPENFSSAFTSRGRCVHTQDHKSKERTHRPNTAP